MPIITLGFFLQLDVPSHALSLECSRWFIYPDPDPGQLFVPACLLSTAPAIPRRSCLPCLPVEEKKKPNPPSRNLIQTKFSSPRNHTSKGEIKNTANARISNPCSTHVCAYSNTLKLLKPNPSPSFISARSSTSPNSLSRLFSRSRSLQRFARCGRKPIRTSCLFHPLPANSRIFDLLR